MVFYNLNGLMKVYHEYELDVRWRWFNVGLAMLGAFVCILVGCLAMYKFGVSSFATTVVMAGGVLVAATIKNQKQRPVKRPECLLEPRPVEPGSFYQDVKDADWFWWFKSYPTDMQYWAVRAKGISGLVWTLSLQGLGPNTDEMSIECSNAAVQTVTLVFNHGVVDALKAGKNVYQGDELTSLNLQGFCSLYDDFVEERAKHAPVQTRETFRGRVELPAHDEELRALEVAADQELAHMAKVMAHASRF